MAAMRSAASGLRRGFFTAFFAGVLATAAFMLYPSRASMSSGVMRMQVKIGVSLKV
jgi:hypothetical protein